MTKDAVNVEVTVTNTGNIAGKETAELYYNPPYTNGGIEKASVNLAAFDKTDVLAPGESQTMTLSFPIEDMASYDTGGDGGYVLEAGDYAVSLRSDSHNVIDTKTYHVESEIRYDESNPHAKDETAAENKLQFAEGTVAYLSRTDGFANYEAAVKAPENYKLDGEVLGNGTYDPADYNGLEDVMPVTGKKTGMELYDLRGAAYDDPRWNTLLDQVTVDEMVELIAYGGHQTAAVSSVNKVRTLDTDGPAGVNSSTLGAFGTGYCSEILIAQTWNEDLAAKAAQGMSRNFEYYSEDSLLSSKMAMAEVSAAVEEGMECILISSILHSMSRKSTGMRFCVHGLANRVPESFTIPSWVRMMYIVDGILAAMLVLAEILVIRNYHRKKQSRITVGIVEEK